MTRNHIKVGEIGEVAVLNHLKRKGFLHIESNFRAKTGEIDLIVEKSAIVHFIEVKSVSRGIYENSGRKAVPHGTYRPEENVHRKKIRNIQNTIQTWLSLNKYSGEWQFDIAAVKLDDKTKRGLVRMIENVVTE